MLRMPPSYGFQEVVSGVFKGTGTAHSGESADESTGNAVFGGEEE
jgi:hypothetical protein